MDNNQKIKELESQIEALKQELERNSSDIHHRANQIANAKTRANKIGVPFDITHKDIEWPTHCPILGIELKRGSSYEERGTSPSLDKINPDLGYVKGNVRVISNKANRMKQNSSREELEMFARNILSYLDGEI